MTRRDYGAGSIYQRTSDWRWVGAIKGGSTAKGTRRRHIVSNKGCVGGCPPRCPHRAEIKRKLRDKEHAISRGDIGINERTTVKAWAETYLENRVRDLRPKAYNAAASPIRRWVVPTIGHRRLSELTPADIRAVDNAQRKVGRQTADTRRVLLTMLNAAVVEGHHVPPRVFKVPTPAAPKSDRAAMTIPEGLALLHALEERPRGSRWLFTILYGARMGECLGLTRDAVDLDAGEWGEAVIEWQLQALPYNVKRDRSSGFRLPDGYECRHLVDAYHLVRPKSRAGYRVAPFLPVVQQAMRHAIETAPDNPWGLIWPEANGRPMNDKHDRAEWHEIQRLAEVAHPAGRPYHVHETRNFAATMLLEAGVPEHVVADLLGHTTVATSLRYRTVRREPLREAMALVGKRLQLG